MLQCKCGWMGVDLVPCGHDNTARCPVCSTAFQGISAKDAVAVSPKEGKAMTDVCEHGNQHYCGLCEAEKES